MAARGVYYCIWKLAVSNVCIPGGKGVILTLLTMVMDGRSRPRLHSQNCYIATGYKVHMTLTKCNAENQERARKMDP